MDQEIHLQNLTPHLNPKSCRTSLYRIKKTFKITSDSPPSSDQKPKIHQVSLVPLNLENIQTDSKTTTEQLLTSPNSKPFWPSTIIKQNAYRIDNFELFQSPSKNHLKLEDKMKMRIENNNHRFQLKKKTKSEMNSLSTSRNDSRNQVLFQSAQRIDSISRNHLPENLTLGIVKTNRKPLQTSVNESLSEVRQISCLTTPSKPIFPTIKSPRLINERIRYFQSPNGYVKNKVPSKSRQAKKENNIQVIGDLKNSTKPTMINNKNILNNGQLFIDNTKFFMIK